jgi:inner membrane protein
MGLNAIFSPWLIWFLLGIGFAFLELFMPGFIVVFFGVGCWVVAGILLIWNLPVSAQIGIFIAGTIISIILLRKFLIQIFRGRSSDKADEGLDDFPSGVHVKVIAEILPNRNGRIAYRGAPWDAASDEQIAEGETVEIIRHADKSSLVFFVKKINLINERKSL